MKYTLPSKPVYIAFLIIILLIFSVFGYHYETGLPKWLMGILGMLTGAGAFMVSQLLLSFLSKWINKLPRSINVLGLSMLFSLWFARWMGFGIPDQVFYPASIGLALLGMLAVFSLTNRKRMPWMLSTLGILSPFALLIFLVAWFANEGYDPYAKELKEPHFYENAPLLSSNGLSSPASNGDFPFDYFTYGSGTDKHRPEYRDEVKYQTQQVDASLLLPEWKGKKKKWRERYWGFGQKAFPLNGRVHFPQGKGPFPIALIVHGNHSMIDYSDAGYTYLGELLASRGIISVSVDENFINGHWSGDFRGREMPARAWLLLKHLEQWQKWNDNKDHELSGKIDLRKVMLVGHSRGGEAVSIAAAFNELSFYPDNAKAAFDFNFGIKGVVSIAPTDYRYHRQIELKNVNYLSLQGAYDADEVSFWGMRNYRRLQFTDSLNWFKAGVYIHRANHGQFNSSWGRADFGAPGKWLLNTKPLISGEEQRTVAKVFISAFAEAVLNNNPAYLPLFSNVNQGRDWLPENYYLTHFQDSQDSIIQDFEEDINLATGQNGLQIRTEHLKIWREEKLGSRTRMSQENNVAVLGWDYGDEVKKDSLATYSLAWTDGLGMSLDSTDQLLITAAAGNFKSLDQLKKKKPDQASNTANKKKIKRKEPQLDFHIQLVDQQNNTARIRLGQIKPIAPPLKVQFMKLKSYGEDRIGRAWEVHLESFTLPLSTFENIHRLDLRSLKEIQLIFDQCPYGVVVIDEIGFSTGSPFSSNI